MHAARFVAIIVLGLAVASINLGARGADAAADKDVVKQLLQKAAAGKPRAELVALKDSLRDGALRARVDALLPELEAAARASARVAFFTREAKRLQGQAVVAPGGPAWLRDLVGPEPMRVFDRLTELVFNEHTDGHAERKVRPAGQAVDDAWLKNVAGLPHLTRLELSGTNISDAGLAPVRSLQNLERLNICLCPVGDGALKHLAGLTRLKRLVLCASKITGAGFKEVPDLPAIESINLHSSPASDAGLREISRFTNLQRLEIVHSKVTDAGLAHLARLTNLRQLHIASHDTTRQGLAFVDKLTKLHQLDVYEALASNEGLAHIARLPNLKMLSLFVGPADDRGVAQLRTLTNLEELNLGGMAQVTDASVDTLAALPRLKKLATGGTKISPAGLARLRAARPGLEIAK